MDEDDLPPKPRDDVPGFSGELGRTVSGFVWIAIFFAVAGVLLYAAVHWLH